MHNVCVCLNFTCNSIPDNGRTKRTVHAGIGQFDIVSTRAASADAQRCEYERRKLSTHSFNYKSDHILVARLFANNRSYKLCGVRGCAPSESDHTGLRTHSYRNNECVQALTSCVCMLTSLPGDVDTEYTVVYKFNLQWQFCLSLINRVRVLYTVRMFVQ